jgi:hypothetical protein
MKKLFVALAAVALLGGCIKMDKSPPKDLPAYVKLYPGSTSVMNMSVGGMSVVALQVSAKPDDVIAFYRTQAASDGLPESAAPATANAPPDQKTAVFGDPATGRMLVVVARPQGEGSMISLTYKPAPKAPS